MNFIGYFGLPVDVEHQVLTAKPSITSKTKKSLLFSREEKGRPKLTQNDQSETKSGCEILGDIGRDVTTNNVNGINEDDGDQLPLAQLKRSNSTFKNCHARNKVKQNLPTLSNLGSSGADTASNSASRGIKRKQSNLFSFSTRENYHIIGCDVKPISKDLVIALPDVNPTGELNHEQKMSASPSNHSLTSSLIDEPNQSRFCSPGNEDRPLINQLPIEVHESMQINSLNTQPRRVFSLSDFPDAETGSRDLRTRYEQNDHELSEININNNAFSWKPKKQHWKETKRMNHFSIQNIIHGRSQSKRNHESRILHGRSTSHIMTHLFGRSIASSNFSRIASSAIHAFSQSGSNWNLSQTLVLDTSSNNSSSEVTSLSFDKEGILLATGDDKGFVTIYDFDNVNALDAKKRNEKNQLEFMEQNVAETSDKVDSISGNTHRNDSMDQTTASVVGHSCNQKQMEHESSFRKALSKPITSFSARGGSFRITDLQWNPNNQDQLAVSFAQSHEVYLYDVGSCQTPLPHLKIGSRNLSKGIEGISVIRFLSSKHKSSSTLLLTGGFRGKMILWSIPNLKRGQSLSNLLVRSVWSVDLFESRDEGISDILLLSSTSKSLKDTTIIIDKPNILISGNVSSLVLLDANKSSRKAFSTSITPTILSTWDLFVLTSRELSKLNDSTSKLPSRRWIGVNRMSLLKFKCEHETSWYMIGVVLNCGWVLVIDLTITPTKGRNETSTIQSQLRVRIMHRTPRIQCFNSSHERVAIIGGVALNFSLPDSPISSSILVESLKSMVWVVDVKAKRYTMSSKDKNVLCEQHGMMSLERTHTSMHSEVSTNDRLLRPGEGLILLDVSADFEQRQVNSCEKNSEQPEMDCPGTANILARLPLKNGTPLSLAVHPTGEWMVVSYRLKGRRSASVSLELMCLRKLIAA